MLIFRITYSSDSETYDFADLKQFIKLTNDLFAECLYLNFYTTVDSNNVQNAPSYRCIQNDCWHLPPSYEHILQLKPTFEKSDDVLKMGKLYFDFCDVAGYTFELVSLP